MSRLPAVPLAALAALTALVLGGCSDNVVEDETGAPTGTPSGPPPAPPGTDSGVEDAESFPATPDPEAGLASVIGDSETVAKAMQEYYGTDAYPGTLDDFVDSVDEAGVALSIGNEIGGYVLDGDTAFRLCVEDEQGDYAVYDTASKSVTDDGETGGCTLTEG